MTPWMISEFQHGYHDGYEGLGRDYPVTNVYQDGYELGEALRLAQEIKSVPPTQTEQAALNTEPDREVRSGSVHGWGE